MRVIRTDKYSMLRRLRLVALFVVLLIAAIAVLADKPPKELYQHVTTTSELVYKGECKVDSLGVVNASCLIFYNAAADRTWVVLFDQDKDGNYHVTRVMLVTSDGKETTAWCRDNVCF